MTIRRFLDVAIVREWAMSSIVDATFISCNNPNCRNASEHDYRFDGQVFWQMAKGPQ